MLYQIVFVLSLVGPEPMDTPAKSRLEVADSSLTIVNPIHGWVCADEDIVCNDTTDRVECYCKAKLASK